MADRVHPGAIPHWDKSRKSKSGTGPKCAGSARRAHLSETAQTCSESWWYYQCMYRVFWIREQRISACSGGERCNGGIEAWKQGWSEKSGFMCATDWENKRGSMHGAVIVMVESQAHAQRTILTTQDTRRTHTRRTHARPRRPGCRTGQPHPIRR